MHLRLFLFQILLCPHGSPCPQSVSNRNISYITLDSPLPLTYCLTILSLLCIIYVSLIFWLTYIFGHLFPTRRKVSWKWKHAEQYLHVEGIKNICAGWAKEWIYTLSTMQVFTEHTKLSSNHSWKWKQTTVEGNSVSAMWQMWNSDTTWSN